MIAKACPNALRKEWEGGRCAYLRIKIQKQGVVAGASADEHARAVPRVSGAERSEPGCEQVVGVGQFSVVF